jgi:hypothetical protein
LHAKKELEGRAAIKPRETEDRAVDGPDGRRRDSLFDSDGNMYLQEMDVDPYPVHETYWDIDHGVRGSAIESAPTKCASLHVLVTAELLVRSLNI